MNNNILHQSNFDPIVLEIKLEIDLVRSLAQKQFSITYKDEPPNSFADGKWDGYLDFEPEAHQWHADSYKQGYLSGVAQRLDEQFAY